MSDDEIAPNKEHETYDGNWKTTAGIVSDRTEIIHNRGELEIGIIADKYSDYSCIVECFPRQEKENRTEREIFLEYYYDSLWCKCGPSKDSIKYAFYHGHDECELMVKNHLHCGVCGKVKSIG